MEAGMKGRTEFNPKTGLLGGRAEKMMGDVSSRVHYINKAAAYR